MAKTNRWLSVGLWLLMSACVWILIIFPVTVIVDVVQQGHPSDAAIMGHPLVILVSALVGYGFTWMVLWSNKKIDEVSAAHSLLQGVGEDAVFRFLREKALEFQKLCDREAAMRSRIGDLDPTTTTASGDELNEFRLLQEELAKVKKEFWVVHAAARSAGFSVFRSFKDHVNWQQQQV